MNSILIKSPPMPIYKIYKIYLYVDIQTQLIDAGKGFPPMFMDRTLYKVFFHMNNTVAVF